MPLNTQLQDVNRAMDPGVRVPDTTDMSGFNMAYQIAAREREKRQEEASSMEKIKGALGQGAGKSWADNLAEISQKPSEEIMKAVGRMSHLSITPQGKSFLATLTEIADQKRLVEQNSIAKQIEIINAKEQARLAMKYPGKTPEAAKALENEELFEVESAKTFGVDVSGLITPDDFDANGDFLPGVKGRIRQNAPPIQRLQTQEDIALARTQGQLDLAAFNARWRTSLNEATLRNRMDIAKANAVADLEAIKLRSQLAPGRNVTRNEYINRHSNEIMKSVITQIPDLDPTQAAGLAAAVAGKVYDEQMQQSQDTTIEASSAPGEPKQKFIWDAAKGTYVPKP